MSPKPNRYKFLLDEMFPARRNFPNLNKLHNLKHIVHDFGLSGISDQKVVNLAKKDKRILISKNEKHMINMCTQNGVKLICITEKMQYEEVDKQVVSSLKLIKDGKTLIKLSHIPRKR